MPRTDPATLPAEVNLASLSDDAKAIAGVWFARMKVGSDRSELTLHLKVSKPAPRTQAALDELVEKGVISRRIRTPAEGDAGAHTYQPLVDCFDAYDWMRERMFSDPDSISWPMMVPVDGVDKPLPGTMTLVRE